MSDTSLSRFSTCEISDALVKLGVSHGGYLPDIHMMSPLSGSATRICGPAFTVKMVLASDNSAPKLKEHFVDIAPPGSVIVIDVPHEAKNAVWGGLMTAGAQARQAVGVVISGRCRDLAEHRAAGFPVFARSHSTLGQSTFTRPSAVDVSLTIKAPLVPEGIFNALPSVVIRPGNWIIADEDGVVCVPMALEGRVVELAAEGREIDVRCLEDIKAGLGVQASFDKHRTKAKN